MNTFSRKMYQRLQQLKHLSAPLEQLTQRYLMFVTHVDRWTGQQRYGVLGGALLLLCILWYLLWIVPMQADRQQQHNRIRALQYSITQLERQGNTIIAESNIDPNAPIRQAIETLTNDINQIKAKTSLLTSGQISPSQLSQLLKSMVHQQDGLKLLRLASLAALPITPSQSGHLSNVPDQVPTLYLHPIELEFEGDFFATLAFLQELKKQAKIYWGGLQYVVMNHPLAKVSIQLHLLSKREHWDEL